MADAAFRGPDRRAVPTPFLSRYTFFGGRRSSGGRREGENVEVFVDVHGAGLWLVVLSIVALNFLDAWFTVYFLSFGGIELNPVVDAMLGFGTWPFIVVKSLGIGVCVGMLTVAKNFRYARFGLTVVLVGYLVLMSWHFWLWAQVG